MSYLPNFCKFFDRLLFNWIFPKPEKVNQQVNLLIISDINYKVITVRPSRRQYKLIIKMKTKHVFVYFIQRPPVHKMNEYMFTRWMRVAQDQL